MTNTKQKQRIKCDINLDTIARKCPTRKMFLKLFVCTKSLSFSLLTLLSPFTYSWLGGQKVWSMSDNLSFPELWTSCCGPFLPSLHSVFHKRSGLLVSFDCFDNCWREREREDRERERWSCCCMQQSCEQQTCSSNALVNVTQCVFCCGRKKRAPDTPQRLPWRRQRRRRRWSRRAFGLWWIESSSRMNGLE